jgi:hypothetical protein
MADTVAQPFAEITQLGWTKEKQGNDQNNDQMHGLHEAFEHGKTPSNLSGVRNFSKLNKLPFKLPENNVLKPNFSGFERFTPLWAVRK